jgi:hypothetical protein
VSGGHYGGDAVVGFELRTDVHTTFLPDNMDYYVYAWRYSTTYGGLGTLAGPLGDGIKMEYAFATLHTYFSITDLPLHTAFFDSSAELNVNFQAISSILQAYFAPDEAATTSADPNVDSEHSTDDNCTALWVTSIPPAYADGEAPDWGPYLDEQYQYRISERHAPEDWAGSDPSLQVLAVTRGGGDYVEIDVDARRAYEEELQPLSTAYTVAHSEVGRSILGFQFDCLPLEMWQTDPIDGAVGPYVGGVFGDSVQGRYSHFRGDARFALKLHVRPAPFVGIFEPPLEPATPVFPDIAGAPGPDRATFWPQ